MRNFDWHAALVTAVIGLAIMALILAVCKQGPARELQISGHTYLQPTLTHAAHCQCFTNR